MPYAMQTLLTRLEKKNIAIENRAEKTMKHAKRYLKNKATKTADEMYWDNSFSDMQHSAKELKYLIREKKEILNLIDEAKKNEIVLPEILVKFQENLRKSFIADRTWRRDWLKGQWEEVYKPMMDAAGYDIWHKFVNGKYRNCFDWEYKTHAHYLLKGAVIADEDKDDLKLFLDHEEATAWKHINSYKMNESDESIEKRSAKDAKELVEDLYTRTFGFTGEVESYDGLDINQDNNGFAIINGVIRGKNGSCKVTSIGAGGYNIQCWHIRVLVHSL